MEKRTKRKTTFKETEVRNEDEIPSFDSPLKLSDLELGQLDKQTAVLRIVTFSIKPNAEVLEELGDPYDLEEKRGKFVHVLASFPDGFEYDIFEAVKTSDKLRTLIKRVNSLIELEEKGFGDIIEKISVGDFGGIDFAELIGRAIFAGKGPGKHDDATRKKFNVEAIFGEPKNKDAEDPEDTCQCPGCQLRRAFGIKKSDK